MNTSEEKNGKLNGLTEDELAGVNGGETDIEIPKDVYENVILIGNEKENPISPFPSPTIEWRRDADEHWDNKPDAQDVGRYEIYYRI